MKNSRVINVGWGARTLFLLLVTCLAVSGVGPLSGDQGALANGVESCETRFRPVEPQQEGGAGPYLVKNANNLVWISDMSIAGDTMSRSYKLTADIDLEGCRWNPTMEPLEGEFDGDHHSISGLFVDGDSGSTNRGLFNAVYPAGVVSRLHLVDVFISGGSNVGGIAGWNRGLIEQSSVQGDVEELQFGVVGLIAGENSGTIRFSRSSGRVVASSPSGGLGGGIAGFNTGAGIIHDTYSTAEVSGIYGMGGLVGDNRGTIRRSFASGNVSGGDSVGGLVGTTLNTSTIVNTFSTGSVTASGDYVGGLVGENAGSVIDSFTRGSVSSQSGGSFTGWGIGGLIGYHASGSIIASRAVGSVSGAEAVGGLVGGLESGVDTSYARGAVSGVESVGGLIGQSSGVSAIVDQSWSAGATNGEQVVGGLVGFLSSGSAISQSFSASTVYADDAVAGGLVGYSPQLDNAISDSYAVGSVEASRGAGGLVGVNVGSISRSYASGDVSAAMFEGGLVGANTASYSGSRYTPSITSTPSGLNAVAASVWDSSTTGESSSISGSGSSSVGATTTASMVSLATYTGLGWKIVASSAPSGPEDQVWGITSERNCGYPFLWWQTVSSCAVPAISTLAEDLTELADSDAWYLVAATGYEDPVLEGPRFSGSPEELTAESVIWGFTDSLNEGLPFLWWEREINQVPVLDVPRSVRPQSPSSGNAEASIVFSGEVGQQVAGTLIRINATGLLPGSEYSLVVRSSPVTLASGKVDADGKLSFQVALPTNLSAGIHSITLHVETVSGVQMAFRRVFEVGLEGQFTFIGELEQLRIQLAATGQDKQYLWLFSGASLGLVFLGICALGLSRKEASQA